MKPKVLSAAICVALFAVPIINGQVSEPLAGASHDRPTPAATEPSAQTPHLTSGNALAVNCQGDQLTITTNNSTLANILAEVRKCTGTVIDLPAGAGDIRFFDTIGPGSIREVLESLFGATGLNYVIESSASDPKKVQSVVLMARTDDTAPSATGDQLLTPARRAYLQMLQKSKAATSQAHDETSGTSADSENAAKEQSPPAQPDNPNANSSQEAPTDQSAASATVAASPAPDTPPPSAPGAAQDSGQPNAVDSQITNMQQMFEQRRQMIQNSSSAPQ